MLQRNFGRKLPVSRNVYKPTKLEFPMINYLITPLVAITSDPWALYVSTAVTYVFSVLSLSCILFINRPFSELKREGTSYFKNIFVFQNKLRLQFPTVSWHLQQLTTVNKLEAYNNQIWIIGE